MGRTANKLLATQLKTFLDEVRLRRLIELTKDMVAIDDGGTLRVRGTQKSDPDICFYALNKRDPVFPIAIVQGVTSAGYALEDGSAHFKTHAPHPQEGQQSRYTYPCKNQNPHHL